MIYRVTVGERVFVVDVGSEALSVDGEAVDVDFASLGSGPLHALTLDGVSHTISAHRRGGERWALSVDGERIEAEAVDERTAVIRAMSGRAGGRSGPRPVVAPMPGLVVRVDVEEGDVVEAGQSVAIVEAMKMENDLAAEGAGRVTRVLVAAGDTVEKDQLMVDLAPVERVQEDAEAS